MKTNTIPCGMRTWQSAAMKPVDWRWTGLSAALLALSLQLLAFRPCQAVTFSGNSHIQISDTSGGLSWNNNVGAQALTVQCWFKISIPSGVNPTENMTILINRSAATGSDKHAYFIYYDINKNSIQFSAKGTAPYLRTLIESVWPDRWYHVAVVRSGSSITAYVDGLEVSSESPNIGDARTTEGVCVGGWTGSGNGWRLYGEVQEVAIYQAALQASQVFERMFTDQRNEADLVGYYKLGYSTNSSEFYKNFATAKPTGTDPAFAVGAGALVFEETNWKGEQSLFDSQVNGGQGAVAPLSGAFAWQHSAFSRAVPGIPFDFTIGYSPAAANNNLGEGWNHSLAPRVITEGSTKEYKLITWQGGVETWDRTNLNASFTIRHGEYRGELLELPDGDIEWTTPQRQVYRFRPAANPKQSTMGGRLKGIRDFNGNSLTLHWDESRAYVTNVVDSTGGSYRLNYSGQKLLTNVSFGDWQVNFSYNSSNLLASKALTNSSGLYSNVNTTWRFYYNTNGLLDRIVDPRGNTNTLVQYDRYGRKTATVNALGQATRMEYGVPDKRQITTTDAEGYKWIVTHDRKGRPITQRNPLGHVTRMTYDESGNRVSSTDPLDRTTLFDYDARANLIAQTNALGEVTRWSYHSFFNKPIAEVDPLGWTVHYEIDDTTGNQLRQWDALGTLASYTYTSNGLVKTETDANGHTTVKDYNLDGFQVAETDAAGFTKRYVPNDVGWSLFITNALGEVTSYAYDLNGKTVRTVDALNRVYAGTYDGNGNLLTQTDAKGQQAVYTYDALNQKASEVDRSGATTRVTYTRRGKPAFTTNALGYVSAVYYDAANRQTNAVDALGNSPSTVYDAAGNVVCVIDEAGQRWTKTYDALKRVVAESDPFGNTTRTFYDPAGRVSQTIAPDGSATRQSYDGRGRMTNRVDAAGSAWRYEYDGVGNLTRITDALGGHYLMGYDTRNARTNEVNQDGKEWRYTYDALERLKIQHEPNGTERTVAYDEGGRVVAVSFNTDRIDSFLYDDNDNPVVLSRSGSGPPTISQLAYDPMDRVQQYTDAFSKSVRYAYDAAGRMTNLTYPDGKTLTQSYDARDRLTNQVFRFGPGKSFATSYAYDRVSRLIRRTFPNGIVQTNTFDNAGRLTGLSHAPLNPQPAALNIAVNCTYDRNGNTTVARKQGMFSWPQPAPLDETSRFTAAGRITTREDTLTPTRNFIYRHDENGNMTNCTSGNGQTWTLTYDEDNRSTSMLWDPSVTTKFITNRYDVFGRRVAKTVDGRLTGYVLDLAGDMERVLCELNPARAITAWYVHGQDLAFKVAPDGTLTCYHADAQGNVVALTDDQANTVAEYAYTPYGRSLGSTSTPTAIENPFRFVGSQGVMSEERGVPGLYFMRARYYSAEAGVFLSTDPVKNIGPTWMPIAYAYAEGNPLRFSDPSGEFFNLIAAAIGAAVGAVVGAVVETVVQVASGTSLNDLDWGRIGGAALTGGIMGFVGGATMGASLLVQAAAGLAVGGFAAMAGKAVDEGSSFKWDWTDFAIGAAGGLMQGVGSKVGEKVVGKLFKASVGKFTSTLNVMGKKSQLIFGKTLKISRVGWFRDIGDGVMEKVGFAESSFLFGGVKGFFSSSFKKAGEAAANPNWWP